MRGFVDSAISDSRFCPVSFHSAGITAAATKILMMSAGMKGYSPVRSAARGRRGRPREPGQPRTPHVKTTASPAAIASTDVR